MPKVLVPIEELTPEELRTLAEKMRAKGEFLHADELDLYRKRHFPESIAGGLPT